MGKLYLSRCMALALGVCGLVTGCGGSTAGQVVSIEMALASEDAGASFTTDTGWQVTLEEAQLAVGALYMVAPTEGESLVAKVMAELFGVGTALAHTGVAVDGALVLAEWSTPVVFDALASEPEVLGTVLAEAGEVATGALWLAPTSELNGGQAWVQGHATKDGVVVPFAGYLVLSDEGTTQWVQGVDAAGYLDEGMRITLLTDPQKWLATAHFERLLANEPDGQGVYAIDGNSQVHSAWVLGLRSKYGYSVDFGEMAL